MTAAQKHESLTAALSAFQAEVPVLPKDSTNPHFKSKFASLDKIVEVVAPLLARHGLTWSAFPTLASDGAPGLRYRLAHTSGEVLEDVMPLLVTKRDSQGLGAAITYARRYSIAAVLNLVADEDDDGNRTFVEARDAMPAPLTDDRSVELRAEARELGQKIHKLDPTGLPLGRANTEVSRADWSHEELEALIEKRRLHLRHLEEKAEESS